MANSTGWEILCPFDITIEWDGGPENENVKITSDTKNAHLPSFVQAHFRSGIITFHTGYLFRTPPGWAVWCMGPQNQPKDGIYALSGLVETDWLPFPFTMNWQMTRPGKVRFEKGECFCFVTMSEHHKLETIEPDLRTLPSDPVLMQDYNLWRTSRTEFIDRLKERNPEAVKSSWQKHYMRGDGPDGGNTQKSPTHLTKRRLHMPTHKRQKK